MVLIRKDFQSFKCRPYSTLPLNSSKSSDIRQLSISRNSHWMERRYPSTRRLYCGSEPNQRISMCSQMVYSRNPRTPSSPKFWRSISAGRSTFQRQVRLFLHRHFWSAFPFSGFLTISWSNGASEHLSTNRVPNNSESQFWFKAKPHTIE